MRERIRLADLSVLYICLSEGWNSLERRCVQDACYFRNIGGTAFILCREKSLVDIEAEKEDIPRIYFSHDLSSMRSKVNFYFQIQQIFQKQQIDLIHTFNHESLLPLGMLFKNIAHTPILFTFNEVLLKRKNSFFEKWFISRIDNIFTFTRSIKELAHEVLPVSHRKIFITGAGIDFPTKVLRQDHVLGKKKIMTFISRREVNLDYVKLFLDSIPAILSLSKQHTLNQELVFTFLTDVTWYTHPMYDGLKRMVLERGIEMNISFETRKLSSKSFEDCDIFVGLPMNELFTDLDLYALVTQTPVLLPRTSSRQELVKQGKLGETYHPEDSRELRDKMLKILLSYGNYVDELTGIEAILHEEHHFEKYAEELYGHYERLYLQRLRYSQKKKRLS